MSNRLVALVLLLASMVLVTQVDTFAGAEAATPTLALGFLLLAAYCWGYFGALVKLPGITGYMLAGLVLGPHVLGTFEQQTVVDLGFINSLALAFIAFCAGGELRWDEIKSKIKSITLLLAGMTLVVLIGVTLLVFACSPFIPFMKDQPLAARLAIASIFGVISTASSPSSAIAIISETRAKGPYTETVLAVTVARDVVVIVLFATVISLSQVLIRPDSSLSLGFIPHLLGEITAAFVLGYFLGRGVIYLARNVGVELPIIIAGMGFLVIKFCHTLSAELHEAYELTINLEPLLMCMAAGFTVQNFSGRGDRFLHSMERVSLPIYVAFFAITGASIQLDILKDGWKLGLLIVVARLATSCVGAYWSGRLAGDTPLICKSYWLGFVTQAGVSLGLLAEVVRRFPEIGVPIQTILIAAITVNQIIGPIALKLALDRVGESRAARMKRSTS